jgi:hypothetical protein
MPMTEAEWPRSNDLEQMIALLRRRLSPRQWRLFACACCRQLWPLLDDASARRGVELAEARADGAASDAQCQAVCAEVQSAMNANVPRWTLYRAACDALAGDVGRAKAEDVARSVGLAAHRATGDLGVRRAQPSLLRDIAGNPFRPAPPLAPAVLAWNDGTVVRLDQATYDERHMPAGTLDAGRLGVLADALLDAGCEDEELVRHLREPGADVRGCWAVDVILGKS